METERKTLVKISGDITIIADKKDRSVQVWAINGSRILSSDIDAAINFSFTDDVRIRCVTSEKSPD